jgi:hypothetical protein
MPKIPASLICILALLAPLVPATIAESGLNATAIQTINETANATANLMRNATENAAANLDITAVANPRAGYLSHQKVLRAGFEMARPLNNLDVYRNKSTHDLSSRTAAMAPFDISQRVGNVSQSSYNTDIYKPFYNISQYSRTKPAYQAPDYLSNRSVYSLSGYPLAKTANCIP